MARDRSTGHVGSKNKGRSRSQSKARKLKCFHCHKEGHYRKDCPERKGKKKDNSKMADTGVLEDNYDGANDDGSHSTEENKEPQEQQYNIARNRPKREIRPPQKYGYADIVAYAFSVAESIKGLKQSPRQWYKRFDTFMAKKGYTRSAYDSCVYHQRLADGSHIYLLLYVDDMLIAAKSMSDVNGLKEQLKREFEIKDLGASKRILGMEIQRDRTAGILYLSQKKYIKRVLQRFETAFYALKRLQTKKRKVVDRRASKSRKIRYNVHEKIVNFMAPQPMDLPPVAPKLFENLFGLNSRKPTKVP
ncbi:hypothetical protein RJ639_023125 [Escallonia herrerae]|uniref:CCHC-type domain-containing protein n=1 Tax=Escallonia herrerae TaxID=1293975 RepID=A0AA88UYK9_9ASTE|nr:hypothetical protein RJ639_023125 [Escallonia herrerae]